MWRGAGRCIAGLIVLIVAGAQTQVLSQEALDPGTELLKEQQRQRDLERTQNARPGQTIAPPPEVLGPIEEQPCFQVDQISVEGVTVLSATAVRDAVSAFEGHCLGQKSIEAVIQSLTNAYVAAGFITSRAHIPQQDLRGGALQLVVVEGHLEAFVYQQIDAEGTVTAGPERKIHGAFPILPGDIFQLRDVEQGVDQMSRLASSNVAVNVRPGTVQGGSILVVQERKDDLYRGQVSYDNLGQQDTGVDRVSLRLDIDDLVSFNEQLSLSYVGSENANSFTYQFSVPYGRWTARSSGSYSESLSRLTDTTDLFSKTTNLSVEVERLIYRDAERKTFLFASAGRFTNDRFINLAQLQPQVRTNLGLGLRHERHLPGRVITADLALVLGRPFLDGDADPVGLPVNFAHGDFEKATISLFHIKRFESGVQMLNSLSGQSAPVALFSDQQMTVGGWGSIRGFEGAAETGDIAFVMRNEFQRTIALFNQGDVEGESGPEALARYFGAGLTPFGFVDVGGSRNLDLNRTRFLAGAGLGIRGTIGRATLEAAIAVPIVQPSVSRSGVIQGMFNVSFKLF